MVPHRLRPKVTRHDVCHVTLRVSQDVFALRKRKAFAAITQAFSDMAQRPGFRLCHFSVQQNHLHLIVEADSQKALSRGMQALGIRIALGLNKRMERRRGRVVADRYHARVLKSPLEVKRALLYVLNNARHHRRADEQPHRLWVDAYSSAPFFDGWAYAPRVDSCDKDIVHPPPARPKSWLLTTGWRRHGPLDPSQIPAS